MRGGDEFLVTRPYLQEEENFDVVETYGFNDSFHADARACLGDFSS